MYDSVFYSRATRMATLRKFGFGPEIMKESKVCRSCGCTCASDEKYCQKCGTVLPRETLYDLYKGYHLYCTVCDAVVPKNAVFCPECGKRLRPRGFRGWLKAE